MTWVDMHVRLTGGSLKRSLGMAEGIRIATFVASWVWVV